MDDRLDPEDSSEIRIDALAADKQGKFKEMYHEIFSRFKELRNDEDLPLKIASELRLDTYQLRLDMNSPEIDDLIDWEYSQLSSLKHAYPETEEYGAGVRLAVPKFFINGREPLGRNLQSFSTLIEEELNKFDFFL